MSKRQQIIDAAIPLFCEHGYHATGIDTVIEHAQVAKRTLYKYFPSKEELILACLDELDDSGYDWIVSEIDRSARTPKSRLLRFFDVLYAFVASQPFYGCPFMRASTEHPALNDEIHMRARLHKDRVSVLISDLAREAGLSRPEAFSKSVQTLMEGAMGMAQLTGELERILDSKKVLRFLVDDHSK